MADKKNPKALDFEMSMNDVKGIHRQVAVGACKDWKYPDNNIIRGCRLSEDEVMVSHYQGAKGKEELISAFRHTKGGEIERI